MSDLANLLIYVEKSQQCDWCGEIQELRPYGPGGACICFTCATKDVETMNSVENRMRDIMDGGDGV